MATTNSIPTLLEDGHVDCGVYAFSCSECGAALDAAVRLSDYNFTPDGDLPEHCPIKHCWGCGVRFVRYKILPRHKKLSF
jgi:hypothetical protein